MFLRNDSLLFYIYAPTILSFLYFFFFNDTATTEIYTLSLHDALPIFGDLADRCPLRRMGPMTPGGIVGDAIGGIGDHHGDRKSTRLNSSHSQISYAVFCLKKKKKKKKKTSTQKNTYQIT